MLGKQKCKILKEIRQRIADENDIPYVTEECSHKGNCRGTCPKCESELRYLEQQLQKRQAMGKKVALAALCAGMAFSAASCGPSEPVPEDAGYVEIVEPSPACTEDPTEIEMGEVAPTEDPIPLQGEPAWTPENQAGDEEELELLGDVDYVPDLSDSPAP